MMDRHNHPDDFRPYIIEWDWFRKDHSEHHYKMGFFGELYGVTLNWSHERPQVSFNIVAQDDDSWSVKAAGEGGASCSWLTDLQQQLARAHAWLEEHCVKERYGYTYKYASDF
jgi:hypothetical protein